ncbi:MULTISPECIES: chaperone NapD [Methylomonas]|uniref:Chaperone NapD n=2 Tax=Methylomonas TaxID=416 RepID=A0A126T1V2_9GAMM|nr:MULTISPECIES: chaperone NapD [Methylomonas]AMK76066.1 hypothetical protein JT25_006090 [Methylomonas denitrificans]OAH99805.1 hypothetical protein A1342_16685 [Methylomonas methanica]TCV83913.1 periplasmic nitrate reductase chaperone NapD [Methylomonas methanica]
MNIVGILVQFRPEREAFVRQQIITQGCEVHLATPAGKMVVTFEHKDDEVIAGTLVALQNIDGVVTATLVYHHTDYQPEETVL